VWVAAEGLKVDLHRTMVGAVVAFHHGSVAPGVHTDHFFGTVVRSALAR
jgi:hypothetical protein